MHHKSIYTSYEFSELRVSSSSFVGVSSLAGRSPSTKGYAMTSLTVDGALAFGTLTAPGFFALNAASHASESDASASGLGLALHPPAPRDARPLLTKSGSAAKAASAAAPARVVPPARGHRLVRARARGRAARMEPSWPQALRGRGGL